MAISVKKLNEAIETTYERLYAAAVPSISFDELKRISTTYVDDDGNVVTPTEELTEEILSVDPRYKKKIEYFRYWIPRDTYQDICNDIEKSYKIKGHYVSTYRMHAYLGCGPTSSIARWIEHHTDKTPDELKEMITAAGYDVPDNFDETFQDVKKC